MPTVMQSWFSDTIAPRSRAGEISAKLSGVSIEATPSGWTGLVALGIEIFGLLDARRFLERGHVGAAQSQRGEEVSAATALRRQTPWRTLAAHCRTGSNPCLVY